MPPAERPARWPGLVAPGIVVAMCVGAGAYATAQRMRGPEFFTALVAWQSGKCLTAHLPATGAGPGLTQEGCAGRENQIFSFTRLAAGVYQVGVAGTDDCLGLPAGNGDELREESCDGRPGQRFRLRPAGPGQFMITTRDSTSCLQVPPGAMGDGVPVAPGHCGDPASASGGIFRVDGAVPAASGIPEPPHAGSPSGHPDPAPVQVARSPTPTGPVPRRTSPVPPRPEPSPDRTIAAAHPSGRTTTAPGPPHRPGGP
jgi:hypothetical protein